MACQIVVDEQIRRCTCERQAGGRGSGGREEEEQKGGAIKASGAKAECDLVGYLF